MIDRIIKSLSDIPDHIHAMFLIVAGASVSLIKNQHDTGQALMAAGLAMWRGKQ